MMRVPNIVKGVASIGFMGNMGKVANLGEIGQVSALSLEKRRKMESKPKPVSKPLPPRLKGETDEQYMARMDKASERQNKWIPRVVLTRYQKDGKTKEEEYDGELKDGKAHGQGVWTIYDWHGRKKYEHHGRFEDGKRHGEGKATTYSEWGEKRCELVGKLEGGSWKGKVQRKTYETTVERDELSQGSADFGDQLIFHLPKRVGEYVHPKDESPNDQHIIEVFVPDTK